jgi:hypothetical protein
MFLDKTKAYNAGWMFFGWFGICAFKPNSHRGKMAREDAVAMALGYAEWQGVNTAGMPHTHEKGRKARKEARKALAGFAGRVVSWHSPPNIWLWRMRERDGRAEYARDLALYQAKTREYNAARRKYLRKLAKFEARLTGNEFDAIQPIAPTSLIEPILENYLPASNNALF